MAAIRKFQSEKPAVAAPAILDFIISNLPIFFIVQNSKMNSFCRVYFFLYFPIFEQPVALSSSFPRNILHVLYLKIERFNSCYESGKRD